MAKRKYTYFDFATKKKKFTRGKFVGWTKPTGLLHVPYAVFANRCGDVLVPEYLLSAETKRDLPVMQLPLGGNMNAVAEAEEAADKPTPRYEDPGERKRCPECKEWIELDAEEEEAFADHSMCSKCHESRCVQCGGKNDDGEGYDGLCSHCADEWEKKNWKGYKPK